MRYLSVCSGIDAASVAWMPLGWKPVAFSEIEPFASAVLAHHYPETPNMGDMQDFKSWRIDEAEVDILAGGTPCQSFSVAGLRKGLADPRGNLALCFGAIAGRYRPRWIVWENVVGVLSSNEGEDFKSFLQTLDEFGYGVAWRVLDVQYGRTFSFPRAIPQRRRRVFVVGHIGDWRPAAAVLFDTESVSGNPPPSRPKRQGFARDIAHGIGASGRGVSRTGEPKGQDNLVAEVSRPILSSSPSGSPDYGAPEMADSLIPEICNNIMARDYKGPRAEDNVGLIPTAASQELATQKSETLHFGDGRRGGGGTVQPVSVAQNQRGEVRLADVSPSVPSSRGARPGQGGPAVFNGLAVRKLVPKEVERLMGFPDNYTKVPWNGYPAKDCPWGPRYRVLGNSWGVNCAEWIGQRIKLVEGAMK